jgi:hypothetical protein
MQKKIQLPPLPPPTAAELAAPLLATLARRAYLIQLGKDLLKSGEHQ